MPNTGKTNKCLVKIHIIRFSGGHFGRKSRSLLGTLFLLQDFPFKNVKEVIGEITKKFVKRINSI